MPWNPASPASRFLDATKETYRRWDSIGRLLIMVGRHARSEALFYYFRLEDQVPENHLLRLINGHISFEFVRQQLKDSYSETGRRRRAFI
jgi:hypothetical protein